MTAIDPSEAPDNVDSEVAAVVEEAAPEYTDINLQRRFRFLFGIGIAGLLLMVWLFVLSAAKGDELDSLRKRNEQLTNLGESQQLLIDKLAIQLDEALAQGAVVDTPEVVAAETPGAEVSPPVGATGERGDAGEPGLTGERGLGPTDEQITAAFNAYCAVSRCVGRDGADGADSQVPGPKGDKGDPGETVVGQPGANGADSQVPGPQGNPGADSQVPGPQGVPGQTPTAMDCTPSNVLDFSQPWNCVVTDWFG